MFPLLLFIIKLSVYTYYTTEIILHTHFELCDKNKPSLLRNRPIVLSCPTPRADLGINHKTNNQKKPNEQTNTKQTTNIHSSSQPIKQVINQATNTEKWDKYEQKIC